MFKSLLAKIKSGDSAQEITIVSGLPRSGTSMMMKMLAAGGIPILTDNQRVPDEDNPKGYFEFERAKKLREGDYAWLDDAQGRAVKIIAALLPHLPSTYRYRVLFMRRHMFEILASQRRMLIRRGEDPDQVTEDQMADLFRRHLKQVTAWMAAQSNIRSLDVDFNQLLKDPKPVIDSINTFLGVDLHVGNMADVIDPGLYRQRIEQRTDDTLD